MYLNFFICRSGIRIHHWVVTWFIRDNIKTVLHTEYFINVFKKTYVKAEKKNVRLKFLSIIFPFSLFLFCFILLGMSFVVTNNEGLHIKRSCRRNLNILRTLKFWSAYGKSPSRGAFYNTRRNCDRLDKVPTFWSWSLCLSYSLCNKGVDMLDIQQIVFFFLNERDCISLGWIKPILNWKQLNWLMDLSKYKISLY